MKISTRGRYGVRLMMSLALKYDQGTIPLKMIAAEQSISEKYLEQIIAQLSKAGLVRSFRGAHGGYTLARHPNDISAGEILNALEGTLSPVTCVDTHDCPSYDSCASFSLWKRMREALDSVVDHTTLASMALEYSENQQSGKMPCQN